MDIQLSDRRMDLIEEGLDLAIRIGTLAESGLIVRRLDSDSLVVCGSPDYLREHGIPLHPADLAAHNCLLYTYSASGGEWKLKGSEGEVSVKVSGTLRATNGDMVKLAALGGVGLIYQPRFLVSEELRDGRLVEVLDEYRQTELGIYAVYPSRTHLSAKVRSFVDFVAHAFAMKTQW